MSIFQDIKQIHYQSHKQAIRQINFAMVQAYWLIGKRIVEEEQDGKARATYGKALLKKLSSELQKEFGKGFSERNLEQMRLFFLHYPISQTVSAKSEKASHAFQTPDFQLSWSHYLFLIGIINEEERSFYEIESQTNNWSLRELKRQYNSGLYMRLALSTDKSKVKQLAIQGQIIENATDSIKDPYVLEFLGLKESHRFSETDLENALIDKLEEFLLELGKGFTFVARQKRISFDEKHFRIDLVFYNRLLKCFVLVDLKIGELHHQDLGQMQMYVNYYDRYMKLEEENRTIGLILCQKKSDLLVEMTLPQDNDQIFASRYQTILPSVEQLRKLLMDNNQ